MNTTIIPEKFLVKLLSMLKSVRQLKNFPNKEDFKNSILASFEYLDNTRVVWIKNDYKQIVNKYLFKAFINLHKCGYGCIIKKLVTNYWSDIPFLKCVALHDGRACPNERLADNQRWFCCDCEMQRIKTLSRSIQSLPLPEDICEYIAMNA